MLWLTTNGLNETHFIYQNKLDSKFFSQRHEEGIDSTFLKQRLKRIKNGFLCELCALCEKIIIKFFPFGKFVWVDA